MHFQYSFPNFEAKLQMHCSLKLAIRKSWIALNMQNNKHPLRSNAEGYGGTTCWTDSEYSDTTAPSGSLYYLPFLVLVVTLGTFGYVCVHNKGLCINVD
jgi:hypothetical protein